MSVVLHDGSFMRDLLAVGWLQWKHALAAFSRISHFAATDLRECRGYMERTYQLYILAFAAIALVALWSGVLDAVQDAFSAVGPSVALGAVGAASVLPISVSLLGLKPALSGRPVRLRSADATMVLARSVSLPAFVSAALAIRAVWFGLAGAAIGHALGAACVAAGVPGSVFCLMALAALSGVLSSLLPAVVGFLRCSLTKRSIPLPARKQATLVVGVFLGLFGYVCLTALFALAVASPGRDGVPSAAMLPCIALSAILAFVSCCALASCADRTFLIERQALCTGYSAAESLFMSSIVGSDEVVRLTRRSRVRARYSRKPPTIPLPSWRGRAALAGRALSSTLRQREGWSTLLSWSLFYVPALVAFLSYSEHVPIVVFLLLALSTVVSPRGPRELGRAFFDDMGNPMTRDRLPYGAITLLAFDSIPALAICSLLSSGVLFALTIAFCSAFGDMEAVFSARSLVMCTVLPVLLNVACVLSCGLDCMQASTRMRAVCLEAGLTAIFLFAVLGSFATEGFGAFGSTLGLALAIALVFLILRKGS